MIGKYYVLGLDGEPVAVDDVLVWGQWMEDARTNDARRVGYDKIGDVEVSTVFLGLDHRWRPGPPILWETMVFGGPLDQEQERYTSRIAAVAGHRAMVARVSVAAAETAS